MKVHDKYVIEIEEIIRGYGNNPEVEDPLGVCPPLARIKGFRTLIFDQNGLDKLTPYDQDEAYQRGLNDAWTFADDVSHNRGNILDILGCPTFGVAFKQLTASEAIQKLKEYEERKKAEKFEVGDEVIQITNSGTPTGTSCIVTYVDNEKGALSGINDNGKVVVCTTQMHRWWRKTGRSFPEIVEVLKKMRGEE